VKVKTRPGTEGERRIEGTITSADDTHVVVRDAAGTDHPVAYADMERARTTFEWGSASTTERKAKTS
jgi:ribosome maturation factor RimP